MKPTLIATAAALALGTSTSAFAQYEMGAQAQQQREVPTSEKDKTKTATMSAGNLKVSKEAFKALSELKTAVDANDAASIPAKLAAAQAAAKTSADRHIIAQLQFQAAANAKNDAEMAAALQTLLETGHAPSDAVASYTLTLAKLRYGLKQYDVAATTLERLIATNPGHTEALSLLAETRHSQGRTADAVAILQRAFAAGAASGAKVPESWYRRAVALAHNSKLPAAMELSRQWLQAYPSATSWTDALKVYRGSADLDAALTLDSLRLSRATGGLSTANEFEVYAANAANAGAFAEAKAVLEEGIASGKLDANRAVVKDVLDLANEKIGTNSPALLAESAKLAASSPNPRLAIKTADALYGIGQYAEAAALYRAALGKSGADANLLNLRLGMALARAGDKAGATAALNAVGGPQADLAKYWLLYVATRT